MLDTRKANRTPVRYKPYDFNNMITFTTKSLFTDAYDFVCVKMLNIMTIIVSKLDTVNVLCFLQGDSGGPMHRHIDSSDTMEVIGMYNNIHNIPSEIRNLY